MLLAGCHQHRLRRIYNLRLSSYFSRVGCWQRGAPFALLLRLFKVLLEVLPHIPGVRHIVLKLRGVVAMRER